MPARSASAGEVHACGPFPVRVDEDALAQFKAATRDGSGAGHVPAAFPIVWLSTPRIREMLLQTARRGEAAFHESQSFDIRSPLAPGASYSLRVDIERRESPAQIVVRSQVRGEDGRVAVAMETILRLVNIGASAAASQMEAAQQ